MAHWKPPKVLEIKRNSDVACQFTVRGFKKNVLTVTGSGCVALGHPANASRKPAPRVAPQEKDGTQGGSSFRTPFGAETRGRRWTSEQSRYPLGKGQPDPRARRVSQRQDRPQEHVSRRYRERRKKLRRPRPSP